MLLIIHTEEREKTHFIPLKILSNALVLQSGFFWSRFYFCSWQEKKRTSPVNSVGQSSLLQREKMIRCLFFRSLSDAFPWLFKWILFCRWKEIGVTQNLVMNLLGIGSSSSAQFVCLHVFVACGKCEDIKFKISNKFREHDISRCCHKSAHRRGKMKRK